jgi:translation elongation factor EF-1alpha
MSEQKIGTVTHYFGKIQVAAIHIDQGELRVGETIHIKGRTSDVTIRLESMQIEHESVSSATAGQAVGIRVPEHVREHDEVFKVVGG